RRHPSARCSPYTTLFRSLQAMQGRMPGVYISQSSGLPGAGMEIQIRGRSSLRKTLFDDGNLPLYVIDGVPYLSQSLSNRRSYSRSEEHTSELQSRENLVC